MTAIAETDTRVEALAVPEQANLATLMQRFDMHMLNVEGRIYGFLEQFCPAYRGGIWQFFELSNGGFYTIPPEGTYEITVESNGFQGRMSAEAAGIAVCLFAFSHMSFEYTAGTFGRHFHWLREYAVEHAEARLILRAID